MLASVKRIESYSGHGDYKEMISFFECQEIKQISSTYLVHGELKSQEFFKSKLKKEGFHNIIIPSINDRVVI